MSVQSYLRSIIILEMVMLELLFNMGCSDPCKNTECENNGVCNDGTCDCPPGFLGAHCESFDSCINVVCLNGGVCLNGDCSCAAGFEGTDCSFKTQDKYVGNYIATDVCVSGNYNYAPSVISSQEITKILITNFGNFGSSVIVSATIDQSSFTVPSQTFGSITISGTGTLSENGLTIDVSYNANDAIGGSDVCDGSWQKQ